jgi:hypothetical protein
VAPVILDWIRESFESFFSGKRKKPRRRKKRAKRKPSPKVRSRSGKRKKKSKRALPPQKRVRITPPPQSKKMPAPAPLKRIIRRPGSFSSRRPVPPAVPPRPVRAQIPSKPKVPTGIKIGTITHYFNKIQVGVLTVEKPLKVGDIIAIRRNNEPIGKEPVKSLQINHIPIDEARKGEEIGMKFLSPVKAGDEVFRQ